MCDVIQDVLLPSHTRSAFLPVVRNDTVIGPLTPDWHGLTPSPTVSPQPTLTLGLVWYPLFDESACGNDKNQMPNYMENSPEFLLFGSVEDCCAFHFQWDMAKCREKVRL